MGLKFITVTELLNMFDPSVWDALKGAAQRTYATHIVVAENMQMDSSAFGDRSALCVGPACTYKTPQECEGRWLKDMPSQRQYFTAYAEVPADWKVPLE